MAVVAVIMGGLFGFANFLAALLIYDLGLLVSVGIYSASGTLLALGIILLTSLMQVFAARGPLQLNPQDSSS